MAGVARPTPLGRAKIRLDANGDLVVDKSRVYRMASGIDPDEQYPQSIIKV